MLTLTSLARLELAKSSLRNDCEILFRDKVKTV